MLSSSDSVAWLYPHAVLLAHLPDNQSVRFQLAAAPGDRAGSSASTRWPCAFTRMAPLFKSRNLRAPSRPTAACGQCRRRAGPSPRQLETTLLLEPTWPPGARRGPRKRRRCCWPSGSG
ncbi:hypothetical protein BJF96_g9976 [Verticillium dahliae]|uniref:Uncharacterized protein n=1 Tax=Verticillium dahliae TaxID=27337 RepID=A0AA44W9U8_VERDA|nr:hypothetical protein BJF96_g9976 [Verticillium dahliae]PNH52141.1 hypothetical protein VD0003_g5171 [Verticillium dahliae]